ncbi:helix-turn-helix domain-containing protein [Paenibacillus sp. IB182496]|uniref:Helix-turn-helix domain-containing protein n=2 Tax=Paenibacillus sabuli TaxID=2772509 RepID=A0A927BVU2_9BACL|nr:helix-turn-helix domain-containing protein [Paenibacillus sabuli]
MMEERMDALDKLALQFRWGRYGIRLLHCHLTSFPPGKVVRYHKHSDYEFHFIPRGKGVVLLEGERFELREGQMYLTGPGVMHEQYSDPHEAMYELCLHLDIVPLEASLMQTEAWGDELEIREAEECMEALRRFPRSVLTDDHRAMPWFLTAYRAWQEGVPGYYTTIKQAVLQMMLRAVRAAGAASSPAPPPANNLGAHRFRLASTYIQDNYAAPITLQEVAERLQISARQLQRIFREQHGDSFSSYLEGYRLDKVCEALTEGAAPIEGIAAEHGFSSSNYLYYVFKKKLGLTPGQYKQRRQLAGGSRRSEPVTRDRRVNNV